MNIYELLNRFWLENEYDPCSATEIALYFFLLNKANTRRWKMPFRCSTELIRMQLSTTRQNVLKAREGLHKKGFISFTTGTSKGNYAQYSIIDCNGGFKDYYNIALECASAPYDAPHKAMAKGYCSVLPAGESLTFTVRVRVE